MQHELKNQFKEVERLTRSAQADLQAIAEEFKARMRVLASKAGTPDMDRLFAEETARYETLIEARIAEVQAAIEAKFPPHDGPPPRRNHLDLDRILRRAAARRGWRKPPGRTPDADACR